MKKAYIIFIIIFLIGIVLGIYLYEPKNNETNNYNAQKISTSQNTSTENNVNNNSYSKIETEISNFSTKIYTKDPDRQNNITLTCNVLNNTIIPVNNTFSFCDTVGKATTSKGYKDADVYQDR